MAGALHGPADLRPITPDEVGVARAQAVDLVRNIKATEGHRAAMTAALAAIAGAADALVELGVGDAALNSLRMVAASLDERKVGPSAGDCGRTFH